MGDKVGNVIFNLTTAVVGIILGERQGHHAQQACRLAADPLYGLRVPAPGHDPGSAVSAEGTFPG